MACTSWSTPSSLIEKPSPVLIVLMWLSGESN